MQRHASRLRICLSLVLALTGLSACAESVNPVRPSLLSGPETGASAVTPAPALRGRATFHWDLNTRTRLLKLRPDT